MSSDNVQACHVCDLLPNVHTCLPSQPGEAFCTGQYLYYHYGCDGLDDRGWGCGYRTVQTICSWVRQHRLSVSATSNSLKHSPVPSIAQIQQMLVEMGDKSQSFVNSRQWIGSFEACLILDHIYQIPCKILHIEKGSDIHQFLPELYQHFITVGSPVMMGGETDNSSKGIMGVRLTDPALLVVDPHYFGKRPTLEILQNTGYVRWMPVHELHADTFYNMCLPKEPFS
uniref:UFSP1/2/DUB catalytic domain-containing protein n=1 Tax=Arion vulgaris TaxID=1028688 RepID=A0A0B6YP36_9EUPU